MTKKASHPDGRLSDDELGFLVAGDAGGFGVGLFSADLVRAEG